MISGININITSRNTAVYIYIYMASYPVNLCLNMNIKSQ